MSAPRVPLLQFPRAVATRLSAAAAEVAAVAFVRVSMYDSGGIVLWRGAEVPTPADYAPVDRPVAVPGSEYEPAVVARRPRRLGPDGAAAERTVVPLVALDECIGIVEIGWSEPAGPGRTDEVDRRMGDLVAEQAALLHASRLRWRLDRELIRADVVKTIGTSALRTPSDGALFEMLVEQLAPYYGTDTVAVLEIDRPAGSIRVRARAGGTAPLRTTVDALNGSVGLGLSVGDLVEVAASDAVGVGHPDFDGTLAMVCGVHDDERVATVAVVRRQHDRPFTLTDRSLLSDVSTIVGAVVQLQQVRRRLEQAASTDALTGLANRAHLTARAAEALASGHEVAVILLDLDEFKLVNDSLGHRTGDELLRTVAHRLAAVARPSDIVSRLGGDEFAALIVDVDELGAVKIAERLLSAVNEPVTIAGARVVLAASAGVALLSQYTDHPEPVTLSTLLEGADLALYRSKGNGRGRVSVYDVTLRERVLHRLAVQEGLRDALRTGTGLRVVYQPVVHLADGSIRGVEALARFDHPTLGAVRPDDFIPVAERAGLIRELDLWVLRTAARQVAAWRAELPAGQWRVGVNLSAGELRDEDFPGVVLQVIADAGAHPSMLTVELTESVLANRTAIEAIRALGEQGVYAAIDDFGSGYSSLNLLRHLPVRSLKLDRALVADIAHDQMTFTIARTVIELATALGRVSIAEGVETPEQLHVLRQLGCAGAQGYLLGRPASADVVGEVLRTGIPGWDRLVELP